MLPALSQALSQDHYIKISWPEWEDLQAKQEEYQAQCNEYFVQCNKYCSKVWSVLVYLISLTDIIPAASLSPTFWTDTTMMAMNPTYNTT